MNQRQIVLDTETTGLEPKEGHKIIEIGCVELINRRITGNYYHQYINPQRVIDQQATQIHGITYEFLADKPLFMDIFEEFLAFIGNSELIIHNAPFDIGFIDHELSLCQSHFKSLAENVTIIDTLVMARKKYPGQRNSLDALCRRHSVDNTKRDLHGALLDAELLADVYLLMTGGQTPLVFDEGHLSVDHPSGRDTASLMNKHRLKIIKATQEELDLHKKYLQRIHKASDGQCLWLH